jgi:hypothetical protein
MTKHSLRGLVVSRRQRAIESSCRAVILLFAAALPAGCSVYSADSNDGVIDEAPISTASRPLWLASGVATWPNGSIEVCYDNSVPNALREQVRALIKREWGTAANIHFAGFFNCPASPTGRVRVTVDPSIAPFLGLATVGFPGAGGLATVSFVNTTPSVKTIIHEFGHILGFIHEHFDGGCSQRTSGGTQLTGHDAVWSVMSQSACNGISSLSRWDIEGARIAYGQRPAGQIVAPTAQCLDIPPGSPFGTQYQFFGCNGGGHQKFRRDSSLRLFTPSVANSFLDVRGSNFANGTAVQTFLQNVPATPNQQWSLSNVQVIGLGGTCVDVPGFNFANNQVLQIFGCNGGSNQRWAVTPDGQISNGSFCWDVTGGATANGTRIQLFTCHGGANQRFTLTPNGQIQFGGKCVDIVDAVPFDGRELQLFTCKSESDTTRFNQKFHFRGPIQTGGSFCLDVPNGSMFDNELARIMSCDGSTQQSFDFYFGL